jgi:hypothetical protein
VVTVFLKDKGVANSKVRLNSVIMMAVGAMIEFGALSTLPAIDPLLTDEQIMLAFMDSSATGTLVVALAGALLIVAGVANDRRSAK